MKLLSIASLLFAVSAFAVSSHDERLMMKLGQGDTSEVDLAKIVAPNARTPEVRDFANRMITDHGNGFHQLEEIARAEHVRLRGGMDREHRQFESKLARRRHGSDYDRTYMKEMVQDHRKDREDLRDAIHEIHNRELKRWAEDELKTVEEHLRMAEEIEHRLR